MNHDLEQSMWRILAEEMGIPEDCTDVGRFDIPDRTLAMDEFTVLMNRISKCDFDYTGKQHIMADELLLKLLRQLSYDEFCDAYDRIRKWYA